MVRGTQLLNGCGLFAFATHLGDLLCWIQLSINEDRLRIKKGGCIVMWLAVFVGLILCMITLVIVKWNDEEMERLRGWERRERMTRQARHARR